tara:strand:- start:3389 stop:3829 length:441 start_codon:yes stop_codon:yes gene_type:complete
MANRYRTKEQIAKDNKAFANCTRCDTLLRATKAARVKGMVCASCRGDGKSENAELKKLFRSLNAKALKPAEDEMMFEDCPIAVKERDYVRHKHLAISPILSSSGLSELMPPSSQYAYEHGWSKKGVRIKSKLTSKKSGGKHGQLQS